jgi:OFA family oxalate/formate antiporter-like MFS transporter
MMKRQSNKPFSPSKFPFFYGWVILAAGTIGILMSVPGQTMGVSVFTDNLIRDLGINRNHLSLAYLIGTLGSGLLITKAGKLYDKHGARVMSFFSGVLLGVTLIFLTRVDKVAQAINNTFNIAPSASIFILLAIGFFGIRFFGQGLLTMVSRNMVMKWFVERRGLANAVLGIFSAFGFSLAPKILNMFIEELEWRGAWVLMALIVGIVFAIFVLIFYRDNPKDSGCVADGNSKIKAKRKRPPSLPDRDYTLKEARKTRAFWAFTLGLAITALYISGLTFHVLSVFETSGLSNEKALGIFIPTSVIAVLVQFGVGYASDYIKLKYLLVIFMVGMIMTSCGLILLGNSTFSYWLVIAGNGVVWGLYTVLIGVTWPRFFGLKNLGAISGYSLSWTVIGSALGPYFFSLSKDFSQNYDLISWISLIISVGILILAFKADNPNEEN